MLGTALQHHQAGHLTEAERIYRHILAKEARHADSLHLLGMIAHQDGRSEVAVDLIRKAIGINKNAASYHSNLGTILQAQGKLEEAAASFERAVALNPSLAEAYINFGNVLQALGKLDQAVACQEQALALKPDCAEACNNLGNALQNQGKVDDAVPWHERALALKANYAAAHGNLGNALQKQGRLPEAVACYERSLALKPDNADVIYNLGSALHAQEKLEEAAACYERALALKPDYAKASHNLGCVLYALGNVDQALARHQAAFALQSDYASARFSASLAQLSKGDFSAGWHNYESRWQTKEHDTPMRAYPQPLWSGERLASGRLLIWGEQGIGDEIMFAGLIPDVIRTGSRCMLDCDVRLKPLFARSFPGIEVVSGHRPDHNRELDFAAHLPSGSLPGLFRATEAAFAAAVSPYLIADPAERERFRSAYAGGGRLVGLAWYTKNPKTGRNRSIDLSSFAPLFAHPDIRWVSLQYGDHDALDDQAAAAGAPILIDRSVNQFSDLDVFASQVAAVDMVLTIDNSTAHLAAALGVPTWLLLPFAPDWRWLRKREDSPWYPALRIFRQPKLGDWQSVLQRVQRALDE
jgi:tetratricopeptide (TPR) repeat protein